MAGRPTSLTPERHKLIVDTVRAGNTFTCAAQVAGVTRESLYEWLRRGNANEEPFKSFSDALKEADSAAEVDFLTRIRAGSVGWQAAAWWLERRRRADYGRNEKVEVTGANGGPVVAAVAAVTPADLAHLGASELARLLADSLSDQPSDPDES